MIHQWSDLISTLSFGLPRSLSQLLGGPLTALLLVALLIVLLAFVVAGLRLVGRGGLSLGSARSTAVGGQRRSRSRFHPFPFPLSRPLRQGLLPCFAIALALTLFVQACDFGGGYDGPQVDRTSAAGNHGPYAERMVEQHRTDFPQASGMATFKPAQLVVSASVNYATVDEKPVTGFLSQPQNATEPLPAIITIHEWWGLNDNIRAMTERLAGEGYTVLAVDLYGGQLAEEPSQAKTLMQAVMDNPAPAKENLAQAYDYLVRELNAPKVGSIGWCFGGAWSLQTGLLLPNELDAMVIYYGRLVTDKDQLAALSMPIAGFFGAKDQGIPLDDVKAFEAALQELEKPAEIHIYEDADHAFANPSGTRYNAQAAMDAWEKTKLFFEASLQASSE